MEHLPNKQSNKRPGDRASQLIKPFNGAAGKKCQIPINMCAHRITWTSLQTCSESRRAARRRRPASRRWTCGRRRGAGAGTAAPPPRHTSSPRCRTPAPASANSAQNGSWMSATLSPARTKSRKYEFGGCVERCHSEPGNSTLQILQALSAHLKFVIGTNCDVFLTQCDLFQVKIESDLQNGLQVSARRDHDVSSNSICLQVCLILHIFIPAVSMVDHNGALTCR